MRRRGAGAPRFLRTASNGAPGSMFQWRALQTQSVYWAVSLVQPLYLLKRSLIQAMWFQWSSVTFSSIRCALKGRGLVMGRGSAVQSMSGNSLIRAMWLQWARRHPVMLSSLGRGSAVRPYSLAMWSRLSRVSVVPSGAAAS